MSAVWYDASYDEIWLSEKPYRIIRGSQAKVCHGIVPGGVEDNLELFYWDVEPRLWNSQKKLGWLIKLGDL